MRSLFIVVVTFNSQRYIEQLIRGLKSFLPLYRLVMLDNNSKDQTVAVVKKYAEKQNNITLIKLCKNLGYAVGNNVGIKHALKRGANNIFIVNPDIILDKKTIIELLRTLNSNKNIGIVGPLILDDRGKVWSNGGEIDRKRYTGGLIDLGKGQEVISKEIKDVDFISGTALLIKKDVFKKIGFLKEDYFLYYEDVDFCLRAKKAGFRIVLDSTAKITHYQSSIVGKNSSIKQYYMARNHLLLVERFAPLPIKLRELIRLPKTIYQARFKKYELMGIRDYFLRRFGKYADCS